MKRSAFKLAPFMTVFFILFPFFKLSATEFRLAIDTTYGSQSNFVEVGVRNLTDANDSSLVNGKSVGSFSFLISYDSECLSFVEARKGSMLVGQGWQSFSFQSQINGAQGLIRIKAVADTNPNSSPPHLPQTNQGEWAVLKFWVTDNCYYSCAACPVDWYWLDCQSNVISDSTQTATWVVDSLLDESGSPIDLKTSFSSDVSRCDTVLGASSKRFATFINGNVYLPCDGCFSDRGDLNLNGIKYEIGDYTLYQDYFRKGSSILSTDPVRRQSQIAASDVNSDNHTLRISDLVFLARIIKGETYPPPFADAFEWIDTAQLFVTQTFDGLNVSSNSSQDVRGVFLRLGFSGTVGTPLKLVPAGNLNLAFGLAPNELRILLSPSLDSDSSRIPAGNWPFLSIPFVGRVDSMEAQASTFDGQELNVLISLIYNRGDLNGDQQLSPADVILEIQCVFLDGNCSLNLADTNCDGVLGPADVLEMLYAVFLKMPLPCT